MKSNMREIEFRAKSETTGGWKYGLIAKTKNGNFCINDNSQHFIDENTIGQYTNVKDINGTKIYEDDILCMTFKNEWTNYEEIKIYYYVKFRNGMFALCYKEYENGSWVEYENNRLYKSLIEVDKLEVVGNLWDTPELLGEKI